MRFLLLFLTLILQFNASGYNINSPQENHAIKTLNSENEDFNERSCILFRYYDPSSGVYLSQDPIRLAGNNPTLYGYVHDTSSWVDVLGLAPGDIALGKDPHFKNLAQQTNSSDWRNWAKDGITRRRVDSHFGRAFNQAANRANNIHFTLDGFDMDNISDAVKKGKAGFVLSTHNMTNAELHTIASNPDLLNKTKFYRNGIEITGAELDDLKSKLNKGCH